MESVLQEKLWVALLGLKQMVCHNYTEESPLVLAPDSLASTALDFKHWISQIFLIFGYMYVMEECWWIGAWGVMFVDDQAQLFWQCMWQFTHKVQWYTQFRTLQYSDNGDVHDTKFT